MRAIPLLLLLAGCATGADTLCLAARPIRLSDAAAEALLAHPADAQQIIIHNQVMQRWCPP